MVKEYNKLQMSIFWGDPNSAIMLDTDPKRVKSKYLVMCQVNEHRAPCYFNSFATFIIDYINRIVINAEYYPLIHNFKIISDYELKFQSSLTHHFFKLSVCFYFQTFIYVISSYTIKQGIRWLRQ
jgi:hypothetical protein